MFPKPEIIEEIKKQELQEENMLYVKPYRRKIKFHCGPAALKAYMSFFDVDASEEELAQLAGATTEKGASAKGLIRAAKKKGFNAFAKEYSTINDLRYHVNVKRIPVMVDWFWEDDGHYGVVIGVDQKTITFRDPSFWKIRRMPLEKFLAVWFDYPGSHPETKDDFIVRLMIVITPKK